MVNQAFHVYDDRLEERPVWVPGDLHIGGLGVARGYWRDPERTSAAFLDHPVTGERLYRTGDLGRWLPDGTIEFLGREDFQVQIQGHRIELGEIEAVLSRHPRVRAATVAAVGEARGAKTLVAYLVPEAEAPEEPETADSSELILDPAARKRFLEARRGRRGDLDDRPETGLERPPLDARRIDVYRARRSRRIFDDEPIPLDRLASLLGCLLAESLDDGPVYRYPSAGGLYPVQSYLYVAPDRVAGIAGGTYYHDPFEHRLVLLDAEARFDESIHAPVNRAVAEGAAFLLVLVGRMGAITPMYGEASRDFCLLEAGYLSQLLMTESASRGIGLCPVGGLDFPRVRESLDLEEEDVFLHALLGGGSAEERSGGVSAGRGDEATPAPRAPEGRRRGRLLDTSGPFGRELLGHLAAELPAYMVPQVLVRLDALPLTANGKVDRSALPSPDTLRPTVPAPGSRTADGAMETTVSRVWEEILGSGRVGMEDNFFDLGGSSVHIVQVHRRLEEELGHEVPMAALFRHTTVRALARFLDEGGGETPTVEEGVRRGEARDDLRRRSRRRRRGREEDR